MAKYVLKEGHKHNGLKKGERHQYVGDDPENNIVELTDVQAKAFSDKFTSLEEVEARARVAAEMAKEASKATTVNNKLEEEKASLAKAKADLEAERKKFEDEKAKAAEEAEALKAKEAEEAKAAAAANTTQTTKAVPPASTQQSK